MRGSEGCVLLIQPRKHVRDHAGFIRVPPGRIMSYEIGKNRSSLKNLDHGLGIDYLDHDLSVVWKVGTTAVVMAN